MIYLDNAATTIQKPKQVAEAIYEAIISEQYGNPSRGAYPQSLNSLRKLYEVRESIANFFGFDDPLKVILTSNITFGINLIVESIFSSDDHIITSLTEHNSVLRPLYNLEKKGAKLSFLDIDESFNIKIEDLKNLIRPNTRAVVITAASNVSGKVTNLKEVNKFTLENGLKLIVDGAQIAGAVPFNFEDYDEIIFAFTGHKSLHGPQGTGGFIVKGNFEFEQVFSGGSGFNTFSKEQPKQLPELFEPGTANIHSFLGLKAGIEAINSKEVFKHLDKLTRMLYEGLRKIENIELYTKLEKLNAPIVSFNIKNASSQEISDILWEEYNICSRSASHCAPLFHEKMGTKRRGIVRLSLSSYNTEEEIISAIKSVEEIANNY